MYVYVYIYIELYMPEWKMMGALKCSEKKHGKFCLFLKGMDIVIHWPEKLGYFGIVTPTNQ